MTSDDDATPRGLDQIRYVVGNLWDDFGSTDSPLLGLAVNGGLAAIGLAVYFHTTGFLAFLGLVWAILNLFGILSWVMGL